MPHAYTEDQLVEQLAIGLFAELGWHVALPHPDPGPLPAGEGAAWPSPTAGVAGEPRDAGLLGRETKGEVVLVPRLRAALERLNPTLPPEAIAAAIDELTRDRSAMGLPAANREVYRLLKDGIAVSVVDPEAPVLTIENGRTLGWPIGYRSSMVRTDPRAVAEWSGARAAPTACSGRKPWLRHRLIPLATAGTPPACSSVACSRSRGNSAAIASGRSG